MIFYIYFRDTPFYTSKYEKLIKMGVTSNLYHRLETYKTYEIKKNNVLKLIKFNSSVKNSEIKFKIEELFQNYYKKFNFVKNAGKEFYLFQIFNSLNETIINNIIENYTDVISYEIIDDIDKEINESYIKYNKYYQDIINFVSSNKKKDNKFKNKYFKNIKVIKDY